MELEVTTSRNLLDLPIEIIQMVFSFLTIPQVCLNVRNVCRDFFQITDPEKQRFFWRLLLEANWLLLSRENQTTNTIHSITSLTWSVEERGYYGLIKTLWAQHKGRTDKEWLIQTKNKSQVLYQGEQGKQWRRKGRILYLGGVTSNDHDKNIQWQTKPHFNKLGDECDYSGEWKNNMKNGTGIMTYSDGSVYEGQWRDNCRHGIGCYTTNDGSVFVGEWSGDKKNGAGMIQYNNGSVFEGSWSRNIQDNSIFSYFQLEETCSGDVEFEDEIMICFFEETHQAWQDFKTLFTQIEAAINSGSLPKCPNEKPHVALTRRIHKIRGITCICGALKLHQLVITLEGLSRSAQYSSISPYIPLFDAAILETEHEWKKCQTILRKTEENASQ